MSVSRRRFLGGLAAAAPLSAAVAGGKVIDCHTHLTHHSVSNWSDSDRKMVDAADKLGIDQLCCSILTDKRDATPELFRECNQWVADAMRRFPGRILGYCFVNPGHGREALDEVRRSIEERGFIGIKLYNTYFADEPVVYPVVELAIRLRIPILHHAGHTMWLSSPQPRISDGNHLSALARRYPEAMLICAHICGGGDWEWEIKSLRNASSVYLDTSGSVADEGVVEMAHRILGPDRLLFATDLSMTASVGRMRGAQIPEADKRAILGANFQKILGRRGAR
ncbi:MAG: amidohydrolase family protein [Bryobacteraceae bacterium]